MLRHFGAELSVEQAGQGRVIRLRGQPELRAADVQVPGDPSSAAFLLVAALLVPGSRITIPGVGLNPARIGLFTTLREMGADLAIENERTQGGEPVGDVTLTHGPLRGIDVPASRAPSMIDEYPVLAAAAAAAQGRTRMQGLAELRVKESDRLAATAAMLATNGVRVAIEADDLVVDGGPIPGGGPGGAIVQTHMDHRIAMSALVLGCAAATPVAIDDGAFIDTSFPAFVATMQSIGADVR